MRLTSTQFSLLVEVERSGSLAQAALHLGVTAPAISQQLSRLERSIGATLVERSSQGAQLTELGRELFRHGRQVLAEIEAAEATLAEFTGAYADRLRVGAPPSLTLNLLPDALAATRYRAPDANLTVIETGSDEGRRMVENGDLDVALIASYDDGDGGGDHGLKTHPIMVEPMFVVMADDHPLARGVGPVDLAQFADDDWVSGAEDRPLRRQLERAGQAVDMMPHVPFVTESFDVAQSLADVGVAVALVPASAVDQRLHTVARQTSPALVRRVVAVTSKRLESVPLAPAFLADLARIAATITRERTLVALKSA